MTTSPRLVGNRYELGELIGYGGMAEVHRGRDVRLGRAVAIKILRADLAHDPAFLTRFRREAQSAAGLNYPAIVSVYDTGEDVSLSANGAGGAVPYIVMEFVEGRTLRDVLKAEGRLPINRAMEITAEVCGALDFSHRNGIVHRDIKPANVMITPAGAVKVMDFGIARALSNNAATVTQTAAVIGTAQYLSPEQARGEPVDARSDVYSTGCLLNELVTGGPPFSGDSPVAVAYQHVRENAPLPSSINPEVPRSLDSIVMKALAKNPLNRYQSAAEMRADLQRAIADRPVEAETVMTDAERTQFIPRGPVPLGLGGVPPGRGGDYDTDGGDYDDQRRRRRLLWTAIVAALLLVIGVGAYAIVLLGKSDKPKTIQVPSLVGRTIEAANQALVQLGFAPDDNPGTTSGPCSDGAGPETAGVANKVCTQDPAAGTEHTKDTPITFKTYKKPTVQVPSVLGLQYSEAAQALTDKGLNPVRKDVDSDKPAGQVIDTNPKPYTPVAKGATITVLVSNGKSGVPNLVGKTLQDAKQALSAGGWTAPPKVTTQATNDPNQAGVVLEQFPTAGSKYQKDQQISLTVGKYVAPTPPCTTASTPPSSPSTTPPTTPTSSITPPPIISTRVVLGPQAKPPTTTPPATDPTTPTC
jgi:eukaryotic-like serine/threonine-protein kinase